MAHMLNIQGLEEEENLLHPFFPPFKLAGREGLSFLHQFPASQGGMQAPFFAPAWLEPFQSVPGVEVDTGDGVAKL